MRFYRLYLPLGLFVLLSGADFGLTWFLIHHGAGAYYESNPIAGWWLEQHGWLGLAAFKAGQVVLVAMLCLVIATWKPKVGSWLMTAACGIIGCVVAYSIGLANGFGGQNGDPTVHDLVQISSVNEGLTADISRGNDYRELLLVLTADVAEGKVGLEQGLEQLAATERAQSEEWKSVLQRSYPDLSLRECLAVNLVTHCLVSHLSEPGMGEMHERLNEEFRALFSRDLPSIPMVTDRGEEVTSSSD